jgi:hypothetical protein
MLTAKARQVGRLVEEREKAQSGFGGGQAWKWKRCDEVCYPLSQKGHAAPAYSFKRQKWPKSTEPNGEADKKEVKEFVALCF